LNTLLSLAAAVAVERALMGLAQVAAVQVVIAQVYPANRQVVEHPLNRH